MVCFGFQATILSKLLKYMFSLSSVKMNCLMSKSIQGTHVMKITRIFNFGINHNWNPSPLTNGHESLSLGQEADYSSPTSDEDKKTWFYTATLGMSSLSSA